LRFVAFTNRLIILTIIVSCMSPVVTTYRVIGFQKRLAYVFKLNSWQYLRTTCEYTYGYVRLLATMISRT